MKLDNTSHFVIAGGGAAGWITALYLKQYFPDTNITLIQSKEIGILGAGEGTTPHFIRVLDELKIPVDHLVQNTQCTIKSGIKFTNWNGDGEHYYHGFDNSNYVESRAVSGVHCATPLSVLEQISQGQSIDPINYTALISEKNKVKFTLNQNAKSALDPKFLGLGNYAIHFDAISLANYLEKIGTQRGIKVIEGVISNIVTDQNDYITGVQLADNQTIDLDFIFDCTGFARLLIGKHYKQKWISYSSILPVKRAIAFTREIDPKNIPPYTESIAMKYGWMWNIPLQHRCGCGYVFDSNLINDDQALEELKDYYKTDIQVLRRFSFEPGVYEKTWVNNCIAIGLSTGFIEPLEATSIMASVSALKVFLFFIKGVTERDQRLIEMYNDLHYKTANDILTFIYFHYITLRQDTPFWKDFLKTNRCPEFIQNIFENNRDITIVSEILNRDAYSTFPATSWEQVGAGLKFFNAEEAKKSFDSYCVGPRKQQYETHKQQFNKNIVTACNISVDHSTFLASFTKKNSTST